MRNILVSFCLILFTRCVQSGIDDITSDDAWALYLDELNEAIWPNGKLREETKKPRSEIEKSQTRKVAVQVLMDAFPGTCTCKLMIGTHRDGLVLAWDQALRGQKTNRRAKRAER